VDYTPDSLLLILCTQVYELGCNLFREFLVVIYAKFFDDFTSLSTLNEVGKRFVF